MGELTEALHEAVQHLLRALRQCQKVVKGSRALVSTLECINKLFTQIFPRTHGAPREAKQPVTSRRFQCQWEPVHHHVRISSLSDLHGDGIDP
jgi:hypothetical protein